MTVLPLEMFFYQVRGCLSTSVGFFIYSLDSFSSHYIYNVILNFCFLLFFFSQIVSCFLLLYLPCKGYISLFAYWTLKISIVTAVALISYPGEGILFGGILVRLNGAV